MILNQSENPYAKGLLSPGLVTAELDVRIARLVEVLGGIHGQPTTIRETSGIHIYLACPDCLERSGEIELTKRHLAVNAEKYFSMGKFRNMQGSTDNDLCGLCMKTEKRYRVQDLLRMRPIQERGYPEVSKEIQVKLRERYLVDDGNGNMIPAAKLHARRRALAPDVDINSILAGKRLAVTEMYAALHAPRIDQGQALIGREVRCG